MLSKSKYSISELATEPSVSWVALARWKAKNKSSLPRVLCAMLAELHFAVVRSSLERSLMHFKA
jgi:hypothetical protein